MGSPGRIKIHFSQAYSIYMQGSLSEPPGQHTNQGPERNQSMLDAKATQNIIFNRLISRGNFFYNYQITKHSIVNTFTLPFAQLPVRSITCYFHAGVWFRTPWTTHKPGA